jgi:hypothetical protein
MHGLEVRRSFKVERFIELFTPIIEDHWKAHPRPSHLTYNSDTGCVFAYYKAFILYDSGDGEMEQYPDMVYLTPAEVIYDPTETTSESIERICNHFELDEVAVIEILKTGGLCRTDWEPDLDLY